MKNFETLLSLYLKGKDEEDKKIIKKIALLAYKEGRFDESCGAEKLIVSKEIFNENE